MKKKLLSSLALTAFLASNAMAAIPVTELTGAISDGITAGETLIGAGLAITAVFIIGKVIKKGASKIG